MMAKKKAEAGIAQPEKVQKTLPPKAKGKKK